MYHVYRCACLFLHPLQCIDTVALHRYFIVDNCYCLHDTVMGIIVFILNDDRFFSKYVDVFYWLISSIIVLSFLLEHL